jgi:uncharacterized protein (TIGR03437 family)
MRAVSGFSKGLTGFIFLPLALAQTPLTVTPRNLSFQAVTSGFVSGQGQTIAVTGSGPWKTAVVSGPSDLAALTPSADGGSLRVSIPSWWLGSRTPGTYSETVSIYPQGGDPAAGQTVKIELTLAASSPAPVFRPLAGPTGCAAAPGLLDLPLCTVPGEKPPGGFQPPAAGESYLDPNFGARVTVIADPDSYHGYSSPSAFSATNRYVVVGRHNGGGRLVDPRSGRVLVDKITAPVEGLIWDAADDNVAYGIGASGRPAAITRYDFAAGTTSVLADFSVAPHNFSQISAGGTGEGSKDNWLPFYAAKQQRICAYSVAAAKAYCAGYDTISGGPYTIDYPTISKGVDKTSGKRYVLAITNSRMLLFSVNEAAGRLDVEAPAPEQVGYGGNGDGVCDPGERCVRGTHSDVFQDSAGMQWMMAAQEISSPCEYDLVTYRFNAGAGMGLPVELGGGFKRIMTLYRCSAGDNWADLHIGCARSAPYCVVSVTYGGFNAARNPADANPIRRSPFLSEIFVVRDNGVEIRRLAEHRSVPFTTEEANGYWSTPRACISPDGAYVAADSNFGTPNARRVIAIETGYGRTRLATGGPLRAANGDSRLVPGELATIAGQNLSNCTASPDSLPWPNTVCGVAVKFGEAAAAITYASPSQVNIAIPASLALGADAIMTVTRGRNPEDTDSLPVPAAAILPAAPAIFSYALDDGVLRAIVQFGDGALAGPAAAGSIFHPMQPGQSAVIWSTGLPPDAAAFPIQVFVNGAMQPVLGAAPAAPWPGVYEVGFTLDPSTPLSASGADQLWMTVNGVESLHANIAIGPAGEM